MYTVHEKLTLALSIVVSVIAVGATVAVSGGCLASGGDRYHLFDTHSVVPRHAGLDALRGVDTVSIINEGQHESMTSARTSNASARKVLDD